MVCPQWTPSVLHIWKTNGIAFIIKISNMNADKYHILKVSKCIIFNEWEVSENAVSKPPF